MSSPDAVADGTMKIVVGTGKVRLSGGPPSHILTITSVTVVGAVTVVPAIVATGSGGNGIRPPSMDAVGVTGAGGAGNPDEATAERKGFIIEKLV